MTLTYIYPNGAKAPTQAQMAKKFAGVHCSVAFLADEPLPGSVEIVHNMQLNPEATPEDLQEPVVRTTVVAGGKLASPCAVTVKDGNTIKITKLNNGQATDVTLDVWIFRHEVAGGLFS